MRIGRAAALVGALGLAFPAAAAGSGEFQIEDSVPFSGPAQLKPGVIVFSDRRNDEVSDPGTGFIRFDDWARTRPLQRQFLALFPGYVEPTVQTTVNGVKKPVAEKLHMYVAEARFSLARAPAAIDLTRYANLPFLERVDPQITHKLMSAGDLLPPRDGEASTNTNPARPWCEPRPHTICIQSRYQLEGKLPIGIRLVNKLDESRKKIAEYLEFQSELRVLPAAEIDPLALAKLTGIDTPVTGVLEQNIFYVNQIMQFGKFLAVVQPHPADARRTIATTFIVLAIKTRVLERKKEYENVPVLRNLVPAQVLTGNSSFNTGTSISAGLPGYARHHIKAVAALLDRD
jgi:hypothetical protein